MSTMKPCAKCRKLIYAGVAHTCPDSACYYHVPLSNPAPSSAHPSQPAQAVDVVAIREVIKRLEEHPLSDEWKVFDQCADKLTRALSGEKAGPVGTPGQVSVPIKLPLLKVPEIKDWLADDLQVYDCPARAVWAGLLAIVTGISVDEQIAMLGAASPSPDKEGK